MGYVDKNGQIKIPCRFDYAFGFSEGFAAVKNDIGWGYIDENGHTIIPHKFEQVKSFSEGLAGVAIGDKWGYIDRSGEIRIKPEYYHIQPFQKVWQESLLIKIVGVTGDILIQMARCQ